MIGFSRLDSGISISVTFKGLLLESEVEELLKLAVNFTTNETGMAFITVDFRPLQTMINDLGKKRLIQMINGRTPGCNVRIALIYPHSMIQHFNQSLFSQLTSRNDTEAGIFSSPEAAHEWLFPRPVIEPELSFDDRYSIV